MRVSAQDLLITMAEPLSISFARACLSLVSHVLIRRSFWVVSTLRPREPTRRPVSLTATAPRRSGPPTSADRRSEPYTQRGVDVPRGAVIEASPGQLVLPVARSSSCLTGRKYLHRVPQGQYKWYAEPHGMAMSSTVPSRPAASLAMVFLATAKQHADQHPSLEPQCQ